MIVMIIDSKVISMKSMGKLEPCSTYKGDNAMMLYASMWCSVQVHDAQLLFMISCK
jgi:hypothetical protein